MSNVRRIAIARIWHEANSFNPVLTTLDDFRRREWTKGEDALIQARDTATELGGLVKFLDDHPHWQTTVSRCTSAPPLGPVTSDAIQAITEEILEDMAGVSWDGVYLSLHGAMVAEGDLSPDYSFLTAVRKAIGPTPVLAVSFDMHACLDPSLIKSADIMSGYHTYPHVDMDAAAIRALSAMERALETGQRPQIALRQLDFLPLSHGMRTDKGPMAELVAMGKTECTTEGLEDVSLFGGFAYADTPNTRAIVTATYIPGIDPEPTISRLSAAYMTRSKEFGITLPDAATAITKAVSDLDSGAPWPIALVDPADNPLSGGIGDTTAQFRALVDADPDYPTVFCFFYDPELTQKAHQLGEGAAISCVLGGRIMPEFGPPVLFDGIVERLTDGQFRNRGPMEFGRQIDLGITAVLRRGQMRVVISETCQSANDPAWCDLHGINLNEVAIFAIKAKNHFRASFQELCAQIVDLDCPGLAPIDLSTLPYRQIPPSFY